jgi:exopolysaccharide biosynthesis polyprenyl glycosylphosphotransferase
LQGEESAARTLFVGPPEECRAQAEGPAFSRTGEYLAVGFVDVSLPPAPDALGHLVDFAQVLHDTSAETVVVCGYLSDGRFHDVVDAALTAGCQVYSVPRAISVAGVQPTMVWRRGQPLIELSTPVVRVPALVLKRIADLLGAVAGLALLSPLFALVAILIKLDSRGPVFFGSPRWGQRGKRICIWKFRTMVNGAAGLLVEDAALRAAYAKDVKLQSDPRVTRVGKWLRRLSIDEMPQLFNVLTGDMSLVGPRPKLFGEEQKYGPLFGVVLAVPPGMTGLWQVSGRNNLSYEQRIALDVDYVRRCSLWLDAVILAKTLPVVLRGIGAR